MSALKVDEKLIVRLDALAKTKAGLRDRNFLLEQMVDLDKCNVLRRTSNFRTTPNLLCTFTESFSDQTLEIDQCSRKRELAGENYFDTSRCRYLRDEAKMEVLIHQPRKATSHDYRYAILYAYDKTKDTIFMIDFFQYLPSKKLATQYGLQR